MNKVRITFDFAGAIDRFAKKLSLDLKREVQQSWTGGSSSPPNRPPARQSGDLNRSIYARTEKQGTRTKIVVGSDEDYAAALEFGTSKMQPRPFLRPVLNKADKKIKNII